MNRSARRKGAAGRRRRRAGVGASYLAAAILASPLAAQDTATVRLPDVEVRAARDGSPLRLVP
ncbi:MAG TPA: hypothetical protein VJ773_05890, partial [Gemmatimonadales bacterium]|nr:hypothetical protein [Gemmatimonadales bacterium]